MVTFINPPVGEWEELAERAAPEDDGAIGERVAAILGRVREGGDTALRELTAEIEGRETAALTVAEDEFDRAAQAVPDELKDAIEVAVGNITRFHAAQRPAGLTLETSPGVRCTQRAVPIGRVGLYVPGGTAPLVSTVLMLAIPARVAGCPEVVMCTPAGADGEVAPAVLYAARRCGVDRVFRVGGAQAIGAMAYGTETLPRVDKIFGPGNRYVTRAKQMVAADICAVDMPAGPSEVLVLADGSAPAAFAAADMLSQAEHGVDSQAILVSTDAGHAAAVRREVERQLAALPRRDIAAKALENSRIIVFSSREDVIAFANLYAAEHLIIQMAEPWAVAERVTAAGSVFVGPWSPESAGDYASGTNHTLPTAGWARSHSGVNVESFMRRITFQELSRAGLENISAAIDALARAEGLDGHATAVKIRLQRS